MQRLFGLILFTLAACVLVAVPALSDSETAATEVPEVEYQNIFIDGKGFIIGSDGVSIVAMALDVNIKLEFTIAVVNLGDDPLEFVPGLLAVEAVKEKRNGEKRIPLKTLPAETIETRARSAEAWRRASLALGQAARVYDTTSTPAQKDLVNEVERQNFESKSASRITTTTSGLAKRHTVFTNQAYAGVIYTSKRHADHWSVRFMFGGTEYRFTFTPPE